MSARTPILRFQLILRELHRNKLVTVADLAALLEVSARTIERDLQFMRDQLMLPIETRVGRPGGHSGGHYLASPIATVCPFCTIRR